MKENKRRPASKQQKIQPCQQDIPCSWRSLSCFDKRLIAHFLKTNYIWRWQHEHLAPFQKHSKTIWDLSSCTWYSPINSLYDFSLQMFLGHWRARNKPNKLQSPVISPESKVSSGGQCSVKWSFKVTAVSQMSSKLHVRNM